MGFEAGSTVGPRDGQGRLPKHRLQMALYGEYAMPKLAADVSLAIDSYARASAQGYRGDRLWEEAATMYNGKLGEEIAQMRSTQRPSTHHYSWYPIDRALFKKYWEQLSSTTVLQRAGAAGAVFPPVESGSHPVADRPAGAAGIPKLKAEAMRGMSGRQLKEECRKRGIGCASSSQAPALKNKLIAAGWVLPEGGGEGAGGLHCL